MPDSIKQSFAKDSGRLKYSLNAAGIGLWEVDIATNTVIWDDPCRHLFGLSKDNILPYEMAIGFIHPEDVNHVQENVHAALRGERDGVYDFTYRTIGADDGLLRWVNFCGTAYFDEGELSWFGGVAREVTDQVMAHKKVEESERNLRNMILQSPVAMAILKGPSFVLEIANERMYELWGRSKEELEHKSIFESLPEAKDQGYEDLLTGVLTSGITFSAVGTPVTLPRAGSIQTVYVNLLYEAFREADGTISGIMVVATDVSEQILAKHKIEEVVEQRTKELAQANEVLQQTNKELIRSNEHLEEFTYAASHDLKEPIRKIHIFSNRLKEQLSSHLTEFELQSFSRIENATLRMSDLIDDLLLYSHVSHLPQETKVVDLNESVQQVLEDLEIDIHEKGATLAVGKLPFIKGNSRQLQQLVQNLISNALKYSRADVPPLIRITADEVEKAGNRYHLIWFENNGIGFAHKYAERIFQMFARLHSKAEYSGTGVGLSIVKKVVENHHGLIEVDSVVNEGSVFKIYLPVSK